MTSQQVEAIQNLQNTAMRFLADAAIFVHAFGQDHPELTGLVENTAQSVGDTARFLAGWNSEKSKLG